MRDADIEELGKLGIMIDPLIGKETILHFVGCRVCGTASTRNNLVVFVLLVPLSCR